jgi:hypothetical protein
MVFYKAFVHEDPYVGRIDLAPLSLYSCGIYGSPCNARVIKAIKGVDD